MGKELIQVIDDEGYETKFFVEWDKEHVIGRLYDGPDYLVTFRRWHNNVAPYESWYDGMLYDSLAYMGYRVKAKREAENN